jgi:hypothetical protein
MDKKSPASLSAVILGGILLILLAFANGSFRSYKNYELMRSQQEEKFSNLTYAPKEENIEISSVTSDWKVYRNQKYSFEIKYPKDWPAPQEQMPKNIGEKYELKISFKNNPIKIDNVSTQKLLASNNSPAEKTIQKVDLGIEYSEISDKGNAQKASRVSKNKTHKIINTDKGFDVFIYSSSNTPDPEKATSINKKYSLETMLDFNNSNVSKTNTSQCYSERVPISKDDFYFEKGYFYNISHEKYVFNIVPYYDGKNDSQIQNNNTFPEFYKSLFSLGFIQEPQIITGPYVRKTPLPIGPRISCREKNDHPRYSDTKGKHMDEDCCPDPDEWAKPGCVYSAKGYAIMISPPSARLAMNKKK